MIPNNSEYENVLNILIRRKNQMRAPLTEGVTMEQWGSLFHLFVAVKKKLPFMTPTDPATQAGQPYNYYELPGEEKQSYRFGVSIFFLSGDPQNIFFESLTAIKLKNAIVGKTWMSGGMLGHSGMGRISSYNHHFDHQTRSYGPREFFKWGIGLAEDRPEQKHIRDCAEGIGHLGHFRDTEG